MSIGTNIKKIARTDQQMDGYLLGLRHGISLADLDHHYDAQLKEIQELRAMLKERKTKKAQL